VTSQEECASAFKDFFRRVERSVTMKRARSSQGRAENPVSLVKCAVCGQDEAFRTTSRGTEYEGHIGPYLEVEGAKA
jgi:hypothetical protein